VALQYVEVHTAIAYPLSLLNFRADARSLPVGLAIRAVIPVAMSHMFFAAITEFLRLSMSGAVPGSASGVSFEDRSWPLLVRGNPKFNHREPHDRPNGGRPRSPDRACLTGILFVLRNGIPWEMLPQELGCGSGMTCWRRLLDWQEAGIWQLIHFSLLD